MVDQLAHVSPGEETPQPAGVLNSLLHGVEKRVGAHRMHQVLQILRRVGVDRADHLLHHPSQVDRVLADGKVSQVLRLRRADLFFL